MRQYQVELLPPENLKPAVDNPRRHSRHQIATLARAIQAQGWTQPILTDSELVIIAGHARQKAAQKLKLQQVPVIRLSDMDAEQARAARISDNQIALLAGWDQQLLGQQIAELSKASFDVSVLGFDHRELDRLVRLADPATDNPDEAPSLPEKPVSRLGDLWLMGGHRLLCGDSTDPAAVGRLMDGQQAAMCFTDPPYNVDYAGTAKGKKRQIENDALGEQFRAFLDKVCPLMLEHTRGGIYVAMSSSELHTLQAAFTAAGGHWSTFVIWSKSSFTMGRSDYQRQYEPILYGWRKGADRHWCGARDQGDVWHFEKPARSDLHPTMKPVGLVERAIRNSSEPGDLVLDLFAGSGSTLIACQRTGRTARAMELDPKYVDVVVQRWEEATGGRATLADGTTFDALRLDRAA
jgi:DNA modification methylase